MRKVPKLTEAQEFWLLLEKERYSKPVITPKVRIDTVVVKEKVYPSKREQQRRERLMFDAGRAAAGATDVVAVMAAKWLREQS
jgi:hypothetical protein